MNSWLKSQFMQIWTLTGMTLTSKKGDSGNSQQNCSRGQGAQLLEGQKGLCLHLEDKIRTNLKYQQSTKGLFHQLIPAQWRCWLLLTHQLWKKSNLNQSCLLLRKIFKLVSALFLQSQLTWSCQDMQDQWAQQFKWATKRLIHIWVRMKTKSLKTKKSTSTSTLSPFKKRKSALSSQNLLKNLFLIESWVQGQQQHIKKTRILSSHTLSYLIGRNALLAPLSRSMGICLISLQFKESVHTWTSQQDWKGFTYKT